MKKKSDSLYNTSTKLAVASGGSIGLGLNAFTRAKLVNFAYKGRSVSAFLPFPTKIGWGLVATGAALGVGALVTKTNADFEHNKERGKLIDRNFLGHKYKVSPPHMRGVGRGLGMIASFAGGGFAGGKVGLGAVMGARALLSGTRKTMPKVHSAVRDYKAGASFAKATKEHAQSGVKYVFRKIRGRIVRLRYKEAPMPRKLLGYNG